MSLGRHTDSVKQEIQPPQVRKKKILLLKLLPPRFILRLKCTKFNFGWRYIYAPNLAVRVYSTLPDPQLDFGAPTSEESEK